MTIFVVCCTWVAGLIAQSPYRILYKCVDKDSLYLVKYITPQTLFPSYPTASQYIDKLPTLLQSKGFISASIDSINNQENQTEIYLFVGEKYENLQLNISETNKSFVNAAGFDLVNKKKGISFQQYQNIAVRLLDNFENVGYPFAQVKLDSITFVGTSISASLNISKGFLYHIDSIRIFGPGKISKNFIQHYLSIQPGSVYKKDLLAKIDQRLLQLPYLQQMQPWDMTMLNTGSLVNLYLTPKRCNQVNILAGFLPANQQIGGKLLFTIDATLQLKNAFGNGESIGIIWQQIQPKSPKINLAFNQPYIFHTSLGIDLSFDLFKRDSSFLNINGQLGLMYMLAANQTAKIILQTQKTNVLQIDTFNVRLTKKLPDVADVSSVNIGLDYAINNTDYTFNPRKGNELALSLFTGTKKIQKNTAITQLKDPLFDYNSLYDSLQLKSYQLRGKLSAAHFFKVGKQSTIKTGIHAGYFTSANYFRNELFQIGGYKLLRGFDEESIFCNRYAVGTFEYRYLLNQNSNFFIFSDVGNSYNSIIRKSNFFIGSGFGLSLSSKNGIINMSYAVGKRDDLPFSLKQSKIHLGYVSIF